MTDKIEFAICDICAAQTLCRHLGEDEHICPHCDSEPARILEAQHMQAVIALAKEIAEEVDKSERRRGRPVKETYVNPSTGKTEDNALTVNMRLLNKLRAAVKELK